jgi:hypothetical protein
MYVCEKCHAKYQGFHLVGSFGPCEDCGNVAPCYDCNCHKRKPSEPVDRKTGSVCSPQPTKTFDPASLRDMLPDREAAERGRALIVDAAVASGESSPLFGAK